MAKSSPTFIMITAGERGEEFASKYAPEMKEHISGAILIHTPELAVIASMESYEKFGEANGPQLKSLLKRENIAVRPINAAEYTQLTGRSAVSLMEQESNWLERLGAGGGRVDPDAVLAELKAESGLRRDRAEAVARWMQDNAQPLTYIGVFVLVGSGLAYLASMAISRVNEVGEKYQQQINDGNPDKPRGGDNKKGR